MYHHFDILSERMREYRRFNATGTQITVRLRPPTDTEPEIVDPDTEPSNQAIDNSSPSTPEPPNSPTLPPTAANPVAHFLASVKELFEYALRDVQDGDMVGVSIRNEENQSDKPIGLSFRRKDQLTGEVIASVLEKVAQSDARFNALDKLVVDVHYIRMPVGFGRSNALKTKGRPVTVMAHLKTSIVRVKAEENCLAHALVI